MQERRISPDFRVQELALQLVRMEERLTAADKALVLADKILEHYKEANNEWRQENVDQRSLYMTIDKTNALVSVESSQRYALDARVRVLEDISKTMTGKSSAFNTTWAVVSFIIMAGIGIITLIIKTKQ